MLKSSRTKLLLVLAIIVLLGGWLYWNRPRHVDMAGYVPADCLAFVEANNLVDVFSGIEQTEAWKALAVPLGANPGRSINRWLIQAARWTGLGSSEVVLLARSQVAIVFTGADANKTEAGLTIKPLAVVVIETHTSQRRMRPALEGRLQEFVQRLYDRPVLVRKQVDGAELAEWSSSDGAHHIVAAFADTVAIVGNDEASVLHCIDVHRGKTPSLAGNQQLAALRAQSGAQAPNLFGFIPKAGVKPILQAWILNRAGSTADAATIARIFADVFGNLVDGMSWSSNFTEGGTEDHCFVALSEGVADRLRASAVPDDRTIINDLSFVPPDIYSISAYHFRDTDGFWRELNAAVSSHADIVGAIAARPLLRSLFKPYGIDDPDSFVRASGTRLETIRRDENSTSVLVSDAFDPQTLRKLAQQRLGQTARTETVGDTELISSSDNWAAGFANNRFFIGPAEDVRRCLEAKSQSLASNPSFRRAHQLVDTSLPMIALTFTNDRRAAISFIELFSPHERSAFSANAETINQASQTLPFAVAVTLIKNNGVEWTSRSSFGLAGALVVKLAPGDLR